MSTSDHADFEGIATEDEQRIARLQLEPNEELRIAGAYDHWLRILFVEARKQRDPNGIHPRPTTTSSPGRDVRRNISLDWGEALEPELFAQIWIDRSGPRPKVMYRFCGYGYPAGDQGAF